MALKVLATYQGGLTKDAACSKRQQVADLLGVCCEDVVLVPDGLAVSVIDVPDDMTKAREKADKAAAREAEKAKAEQEAAELEAAKAQQEAAARAAKAAEPPAPPPAPPPATKSADYDSWTLEDLHAEATKRDLHGRSALDKAGLVKALQRSDKK